MPLVPIAAAMIAGGVVDAAWPTAPGVMLTVAVVATVVGGVLELIARRGFRRGRVGGPYVDGPHLGPRPRRMGATWGATAALLVAAGALFAAWHGRADRTVPANHLVRVATFDSQPVACEVVVLRGDRPRHVPPRPFETRYRDEPRAILQVQAVARRDGLTWRSASGVGRLIVQGDWAGAAAGDRLRLIGRLSRPEPPANPGVFDFATWSKRRGETYLLAVDQPEGVTVLTTGAWWLPHRILETIRDVGESNLKQHLGPRQADLAVALTLGDRTGVEPDLTELYLVTGAIHVLAISGLHVAILAAGVGGVTRLVTGNRRLAILAVLFVVGLYVPLTGAKAPVLRAGTLVAAWCLGRWSGRPTHLLQALAASLIVVLTLRPTDLFDTGAQLSFLAVLSLALAGRLLRRTEVERDTASHDDIEAIGPASVANGASSVESHDDPSSPADTAPVGPVPAKLGPHGRQDHQAVVHEAYEAREVRSPWWRSVMTAIVRRVADVYQAGILVWLVCLPMVALRFHVVPVGIVLINPVLGVLVTIALYACLVTMVAGSICPPLAWVTGPLASRALDAMESLLLTVRSVPWSYFWLPAPATWWVMTTYAGLAVWASWAVAEADSPRENAPDRHPHEEYPPDVPPNHAPSNGAVSNNPASSHIASNERQTGAIPSGNGKSEADPAVPNTRWSAWRRATVLAWSVFRGLFASRTGQTVAMTAWLVVGWGASPLGLGGPRPLEGGRPEETLTVTFLAVGHGTCTVADLPDGRTLVYDAGSLTSAAGAADALAAHLWSRGRTHIDTLVLSHADADHYNAVPALCERFSIGLVAAPGGLFDRDDDPMLARLITVLAETRVPVLELERGDRLGTEIDAAELAKPSESGYRIDVLHPPRGFRGSSDNAQSVTLRLTWRGRSILLPGDLEKDGLATFLASMPPATDVIMAPHHGSAASSPPDLVAAIAPSAVVLSGPRSVDVARIGEQYRLPPSQVFHTAADGAVTVRLTSAGITVTGFRGRRAAWSPNETDGLEPTDPSRQAAPW